MHAHIYRRFKVTPRLHVKSVVGEGKTTLFDILEKLVPNPERDDSTTPAIIADRADDFPPPTFLLDEADNLSLMDNPLGLDEDMVGADLALDLTSVPV
jgi:hypothetical protein